MLKSFKNLASFVRPMRVFEGSVEKPQSRLSRTTQRAKKFHVQTGAIIIRKAIDVIP